MGVEIVTPGGTGGGGGGGGGAGSDTTAVHSGDSAGGDLTGTYPSPTIGANKVTLAKMATIADSTILGNNSGGASVPIALTVAQVKTLLGLVAIATSGSASDLSAGTVAAARMPALTGDVTTSAGAVATAIGAGKVLTTMIADANVTYAKIQAVAATSRVLGRISSGSGVVEELTAANLKTILALVASDITDGVFIPFRVSYSGVLAVTTGTFRLYNDSGRTLTIVSTRITLGTVNTGASVLVDINKDGTTIFTTQANRPAIAASASPATSKNTNQDVTTIADGSYFTADIDQIGSTIAGADLMVEIWCKG